MDIALARLKIKVTSTRKCWTLMWGFYQLLNMFWSHGGYFTSIHNYCCWGWTLILESLGKRRFCQHWQQPEVSCVIIINGEWWRQLFVFEIDNGSQSTFTFMISNKNGWRHHSPSITTQLTSGCRPCWQKRSLLKLLIRDL